MSKSDCKFINNSEYRTIIMFSFNIYKHILMVIKTFARMEGKKRKDGFDLEKVSKRKGERMKRGLRLLIC